MAARSARQPTSSARWALSVTHTRCTPAACSARTSCRRGSASLQKLVDVVQVDDYRRLDMALQVIHEHEDVR
eukprot:12093206-Heterocapsa_arctica.AAC.1